MIKQIFDAEPESDYIKGLFFADDDILYWWYASDMDGEPTHVMALQSFGLDWDRMQQMEIIPILGGEINALSYNPPEVVSWKGNDTQQRRAEILLEELLEDLREERRSGGWYARVSSKLEVSIVDVENQPRFPEEHNKTEIPFIYFPLNNTLYIASHDVEHAILWNESIADLFPNTTDEDVDMAEFGLYDTETRQATFHSEYWTKSPAPMRSEILTALQKNANIYDPIENELDKHVFKNGEPRQSVINFIKRLYGRALKQEYGIENAELFIDLYITGSLTTFQYSETSDCDVSVFPNYKRFADSFDEDSSKTRKRLVSLSIEHIDGTFLPGTTHPLQFFVVADGIERTDLYQPGLRSAWSIFDEMWVVPPEKERSHEVSAEFPDAYSRASSIASKMADALDHDPESARELWKQVHKKRQLDQMAGLGDYSEGNIVYKWLLHEGLFDRIKSELHEYIAQIKVSAATMYHATSRRYLDSILSNGLLQSKNGQDFKDDWNTGKGIYFFEDPQNALKIGREKFSDPVVLAVDVSDVPIQLDPEFKLLTPENDPYFGMPNVSPDHDTRAEWQRQFRDKWTDESGLPRAWRTFADISPDRIKSELHEYIAKTSMLELSEPRFPARRFVWSAAQDLPVVGPLIGSNQPPVHKQLYNQLEKQFDDPMEMWSNRMVGGWLEYKNGQYELSPIGSDGSNPKDLPPDEFVQLRQALIKWSIENNERLAKTAAVNIVPLEGARNDDRSRAENGYPVVLYEPTNTAYIGPLGSHHADVASSLTEEEGLELEDVWSGEGGNMKYLNIWPPGEGAWRSDPANYEVAWYWGDPDPKINQQLTDWARQQDNPWNKVANDDDQNEIRWGYNGLTGEVWAVKAWDYGGRIVTHMDMAAKWLGDVDWENLEHEYENFFFGYAEWNPTEHQVEYIQIYSLDMSSPEYKLGPADMKLIEDALNAQAPSFMEGVEV